MFCQSEVWFFFSPTQTCIKHILKKKEKKKKEKKVSPRIEFGDRALLCHGLVAKQC